MTDHKADAPALLLGPLLRYVDETSATIWVETDRACTVEILGAGDPSASPPCTAARTFQVAGHHYALAVLDGLAPGTEQEYRVALDGTVRWPEPSSQFGPSVLRTLAPGRPRRVLFGSCRAGDRPGQAPLPDALAACARALSPAQPEAGPAGQPAERPGEHWPDLLLMIGDQVYADEPGEATRRFIAGRRDPAAAPGYQAADFEEYRAAYQEAWRDPAVRWLLSVVPSVMIFDDHDVHDDWNTSAAWRDAAQAAPWWRSRITGALSCYWIYQHVGNLSPAELAADPTWRQVREAADAAPFADAAPILADLALRADHEEPGIRWSVRRDLGGVRIVVMDSRSRRVVTDNSKRRMLDEEEWAWVTDSVRGDWDHVLLATSVPLLLPHGIQHLEAWSEPVCAGRWGSLAARLCERLRQKMDLEHWAAFGASFADFEHLLAALAAGEYGKPAASITVISGDVHHSYLAPVTFPPSLASAGTPDAGRSRVWHAVCSPFRNTVPGWIRAIHAVVTSPPGTLAASLVARLAGARRPLINWRITDGPWFAPMIATLDYNGRTARLRFARASEPTPGSPRLDTVHDSGLTGQVVT